MRLSPRRLLWLALAAVAFSAQSSPSIGQTSAPQHGTLGGIVIKDPGSEPVKKALIELIAESQSDGGNYTALTAADGGFHIDNIVPGRYRMFVERTGYQEINKHRRRADGRLLTVSVGQEIKDLIIRLQAAAVVEGRVTDEDGDPMPEAQVAVLRETSVSGRGHWEKIASERTNDLGEYRIPGLAAGNYFVSVTPPPDFRSLIETTGNAPAPKSVGDIDKPAPAAYQTIYYPGTRDRGQAAPIQLHAGDDFPVNFSLTPSPSLTIRGSVVNLPPGSTAAIMLQSKEFNLVLNGAEMRKDGTFEIRDVSPGAYSILATVDNAPAPMMARQALQVSSANVEGLRLAPQAGGSIRGHLRMESSGFARPDPSQIFLLLRSADGDDDALGDFTIGNGFSNSAHVNADGSLEWNNVPAGHYSVQISEASPVPDWFLKSVAAGGRDVVDSGFSVSGGIIELDLVATSNGAVIEGVATSQRSGSEKDGPEKDASEKDAFGKDGLDNDDPAADAVVVAVPEARFRSHPDRYRKASTDQRGRFTLRGLPPGDYTVFAWESVDGEAYYNPEFLKNCEGQGKTLHVNQGGHASLQLKAIPATEDQP